MSFRETTAWVMGLIMAMAGLFYVDLAVEAWGEIGRAPPPLAVLMPFVGLLIVASIVGQVTLASMAPKQADAPPDERERPLIDRAGNWSGLVLGSGVVSSALYYARHGDGELLFHMLMGSLILSQLAEYVFQIILFRRSA